MQKDALSVDEERIPMENISAMSICGRCELVFSTAETSYEIRRETPYNAYKYRTMFELLHQSLPGKTPASPIAADRGSLGMRKRPAQPLPALRQACGSASLFLLLPALRF